MAVYRLADDGSTSNRYLNDVFLLRLHISLIGSVIYSDGRESTCIIKLIFLLTMCVLLLGFVFMVPYLAREEVEMHH